MFECCECGFEFPIPEGTEESEIFECEECGSELEIISLDPPVTAVAPETKEDWGE